MGSELCSEKHDPDESHNESHQAETCDEHLQDTWSGFSLTGLHRLFNDGRAIVGPIFFHAVRSKH